MRKLLLFTPLLLILATSCKLFRPNLMLRTKPDYNYDKLADSLIRQDYKIAANDAITYRVFTNKGFKMIDLASANNNAVFQSNIDVIVESDGSVKIPGGGYTKIAGLSIKEAEKMLEEKYGEFYVDPFVLLRVTNKRVIVFPGGGGVARVLPLANNNTTVMEAIALAGGITEDGKAYKVKLIRSENGTTAPKIYLMDLSRIEGLAFGNTRVLANDIIYVEPRYRLARTLVNELTPIITLISTTLIIYSVFKIK